MSVVSNVNVYGLNESIRASKYPYAVDIDTLDEKPTPTTQLLANAPLGRGHDQYLTGIIVQFDLTFTIKGWIEMQRYHFIDFVGSQSVMHCVEKMNLAESVNEYVDKRIVKILERMIEDYSYGKDMTAESRLRILYSLPTGLKLTARMTTNYRELKTIYVQRKNDRLPEWQEFLHWIETLPMSNYITKTRETDIGQRARARQIAEAARANQVQ